MLCIAGMLTFDSLGWAFLPPALYFGIHLVEGETLTPMLLARRLTLNPVLVILSLVFWFWMWGVPGAILAVPMLAILKIVCDRSKLSGISLKDKSQLPSRVASPPPISSQPETLANTRSSSARTRPNTVLETQ